MPLQLQQGPHAGHQLLPVEGLAQEVVGARLDSPDPLVGGLQRGDHHDGNQDRPRVRLEPSADLVPVERRHDDVQENQVGRVGLNLRQSLVAVTSRGDLIPLAGQFVF